MRNRRTPAIHCLLRPGSTRLSCGAKPLEEPITRGSHWPNDFLASGTPQASPRAGGGTPVWRWWDRSNRGVRPNPRRASRTPKQSDGANMQGTSRKCQIVHSQAGQTALQAAPRHPYGLSKTSEGYVERPRRAVKVPLQRSNQRCVCHSASSQWIKRLSPRLRRCWFLSDAITLFDSLHCGSAAQTPAARLSYGATY
jgi:hypothetical protein